MWRSLGTPCGLAASRPWGMTSSRAGWVPPLTASLRSLRLPQVHLQHFLFHHTSSANALSLHCFKENALFNIGNMKGDET